MIYKNAQYFRKLQNIMRDLEKNNLHTKCFNQKKFFSFPASIPIYIINIQNQLNTYFTCEEEIVMRTKIYRTNEKLISDLIS